MRDLKTAESKRPHLLLFTVAVMVRFSNAGILSFVGLATFFGGTVLFNVGLATGFGFGVLIEAFLRNWTLFSLESFEAGWDLERGLGGVRGFLLQFTSMINFRYFLKRRYGTLMRIVVVLLFLGILCTVRWALVATDQKTSELVSI